MTSSSFVADCRYAVRSLLRSPGFSLVAILTFAIGIGVNTAVFSVFNGVILRSLPYPDADRIVAIEQAQSEMSAIAARLEQEYPGNRGFGIYVVGLHEQLVGRIERSLTVLLAAVAFVLLIACANLGNLLLGRTAARRNELAIRTALGARRTRLIRQIVTEALVLAAAGSALGLVLAYWATGFFIVIGGDSIPRPESIAIDGRVLLFTLGLAIVAALTSGIIPALHASRAAVTDGLREGGREGGATASRKTRSLLIGVEVALAFVLLSGAGLLLRTLWTMQNVDRGFTPDRVATMRLSLPGALYAGPPEVSAFYAQLLDKVRSLPGVESAATGSGVLQPMLASSGVFTIEGRPSPPPGQQVEYPVEIVSPGYFETLGVTLQSGRTFTSQDHADAPLVVVINETLARVGWPGQDPIGRRIRGGGAVSRAPWLTVVGVVNDLRRADLRRQVRPELYFSTLQRPSRSQMLLIRTAGDPTSIISAVRHQVRTLNPQLPLFSVGTLQGQVAETLSSDRFGAVLLATFALVAVLLASVGIYGVTAHAVGQRTHEVGIRMALGARRTDVLGLMLAEHLRPAVVGIVAGAAGALALSCSLRTLVYGVGTADPLTYVVMAAVLLTVTLAACWVPSRRATKG